MVQVRMSQGIIEGIEVENEYGGKIFKFKGIPYAQPPVGELRFKAPQPIKPWDGVRNAKEHGPRCYQEDFLKTCPPTGSEDCLYLNVYSPNLKPEKPLPVMFSIHGGAFMYGNGNEAGYGPDFLIRHDVILVTFNYRLGVFGFLCLDTEDIPGNACMKDQVAALKWVKSNISYFGGDPNNVTIFGISSGATCVTYHLMSPMTKGLFKRAIVQGGAATKFWPMLNEPRERAKALARKLGLESDDDKQLYEFFKSQPKESLLGDPVPITLHEETDRTTKVNPMGYHIVSEKQFCNNERYFFGDIYDVARNGMHEGVEVIAGYCRDEGYILFALHPEAKLDMFKNYIELFSPREIATNCPLKVTLEVGRKIKKFYLGNKSPSWETLHNLIKPISMFYYKYSIAQWQKICSYNNKTYFYIFSCTSERNFYGKFLSGLTDGRTIACHGDDLSYLFPYPRKLSLNKNSETYKMVTNFTTLWTNFAKFGNPTPDSSLGVQWQPFTANVQNYLDIGPQLISSINPNGEEMQFYEDIMKQYNPHCVA